MTKLLLVSNSTQHGGGYLEHCRERVVEHFRSAGARTVWFVPYALHDLDRYAATARGAFERMGFQLRSVHEVDDPAAAAADAEGFFVGGGNTFRLLKRVREERLIEAIRARVAGGAPYMGTSAGSNLACPTVRTTNDMPIVEPGAFAALDLAPFQINPHYLDPPTDSSHMGETREQRIREFHEENETPVVGLREGGMLVCGSGRTVLAGPPAARIFRRGKDPVEVPSGEDLAPLVGAPT